MRTEARAQRGQALVEALVAAIALVPLALLVVLLGKFQSMQQATIAASRTLAFECSVRPTTAATRMRAPRSPRMRGVGTSVASIARSSAPTLDDGAPVQERNALWTDRGCARCSSDTRTCPLP